MNTMSLRTSLPRRQAGVGMVELMVSMLLGAIVVLGVIQVFTANKQTFRMQDAMALTQESGTFALDYIGRDLLRAGYPGSVVLANSAIDFNNTSDGVNDRLAITYDPEVSDFKFCTGEDVPVSETRISNQYWVQDGELFCQGALETGPNVFTPTGTAQALVDNVESFQVLYGVDLHLALDTTAPGACPPGEAPAVPSGSVAAGRLPDSSPAEPTAYVPAGTLAAARNWSNGTTNPDGACLVTLDDLAMLRTVRIALLVRSEDPTGAVVPADRTFSVLDQVAGAGEFIDIAPDDGRMRRLFTKTVSLRNVQEVFQ